MDRCSGANCSCAPVKSVFPSGVIPRRQDTQQRRNFSRTQQSELTRQSLTDEPSV